MKIWYNNVIDTDRRMVDVQGSRIRIGRARHNDIVLDSPFVAEEAAVLNRRGDFWELMALGMNGVKLGNQHVYDGQRCDIQSSQSIFLFPFSLTLDLPSTEDLSADRRRRQLDEALSRLIQIAHLELLEKMNLKIDGVAVEPNDDEYLLTLERNIDEIVRNQPAFKAPRGDLLQHTAGHGLRDAILAGLTNVTSEAGGLLSHRHWSRLVSGVPERETELVTTAQYVNKLLQLDEMSDLSQQIGSVERDFWNSWQTLEPRVHGQFKEYVALRHLKKEIKDILFGYGPLEDLLRLPTISEIMVVDREHIFIERHGILENSGRRFISDDVIESIIQRIVARVGRRIDKSQPLVDARLSDGSRVNAVISPLAVSGPTLTIRKFPLRRMLVDDLVAQGAMTRTVAEFLRAIVVSRQNVLISGGTGTGKTTLLNCLSDFIPDKERIVTVEDTAELQLAKEHVVRMETKEANIEGHGAYTIRDLVRNALRMRPDRIVVGECRGPEALDMLQAMNTGHDGSLTTIHANNAHDVVLRLEVLVQQAADLPVESIRQQISSAVDVIVQLKRLRDGRRIISQITEVAGRNPRTGELELRDIYLLDATNGEWSLQPTGRLPSFISQLIESGFLNLESFYRDDQRISA